MKGVEGGAGIWLTKLNKQLGLKKSNLLYYSVYYSTYNSYSYERISTSIQINICQIHLRLERYA